MMELISGKNSPGKRVYENGKWGEQRMPGVGGVGGYRARANGEIVYLNNLFFGKHTRNKKGQKMSGIFKQ